MDLFSYNFFKEDFMSNFLKKLLTIVITFTVIVTVISARSVFAEPTGNSPAPTSGEATSTPDPAGIYCPDWSKIE